MTKIPETITMQASPEDELDKMLFEAERLSALMRSSANLGDDTEESKSRSSILSPERRTGGRDFDEEKKFADHDEYSYPGSTIKTEEKSLCGRSTTSSQAPNDSSVQAAIDAARKMELALKALGRDEDDEVEEKANKRRVHEEYDDNSLGSAPSPYPKSPPEQVLSPATVDSKLKNLKKGEVNEDAIKWEKVEAPSETDEDYVPIADYYSGSTDGTAMAVDPQDDFQPRSRRESYLLATKRRARRRRRKIVRALVALVLVSVIGYVYKVFFANKQQPVEPVQDVPEVKVEKPKEEKEAPKPKPPPEPVVAPTFLKQHDDDDEALCSSFGPEAKLSAVPNEEPKEEIKKSVEPVETEIQGNKQLVHDKGSSLEKVTNVTRPMRHWHCNLPFQCADVDRHGIPDFL